MEVRALQGVNNIEATKWNSFVSPNDPFLQHAFLHALEESQSAHSETGWQPFHLALYEKETLVGLAPMYIKMHSYGEYIFDWGWAEAAERAGLDYYPKILNAVPFTPATGQRFLGKTETIRKTLWLAMQQIGMELGVSSEHVLFLNKTQFQETSRMENTIARLTYQFHWENPQVEDFQEWLSLFSSKARKNIKVERKKAQAGVDRIFHLRGSELSDLHISKIWSFYCSTINRKWGQPYLTRSFFEHLRTSLAAQTIVFFAELNSDIIAAALCFQQGKHLYGRYWGCSEFADFLHFELCYHQPIALCIKEGWTRFEAGAQGQHKLKRGLLATPTYSLHRLHHQGLHHAVKEAIQRENFRTEQEIKIQNQHSPFKCSPST